ncbi:MAG: hypothetical protein QN131_02830 [Armatimonadota bacterium]|nr:hypothetical protein [Armatimonadota bacterium]MDR7548856.1 hypothetical protein [Armatimonadota bacterium]
MVRPVSRAPQPFLSAAGRAWQVLHSEVISVMQREFVDAARAMAPAPPAS